MERPNIRDRSRDLSFQNVLPNILFGGAAIAYDVLMRLLLVLIFGCVALGCNKGTKSIAKELVGGETPSNPCAALTSLDEKITIPLHIGFGKGVDANSLNHLLADVVAYADWLGFSLKINKAKTFNVSKAVLFSQSSDSTNGGMKTPDSAIIGPIVEVIKKRSKEKLKRVDVLFFQSWTDDKNAESAFADARGLTVSRYSKENPFEERLKGVETNPMSFVSIEKLEQLPRLKQASVVVHELGHALGLAHVEHEGNIMHESPNLKCDGVFNVGQLESMKDSAADF